MLFEEARILLQKYSFKQVFSNKKEFNCNNINKDQLNNLYYTFGKIFYFDINRIFGYFLCEEDSDINEIFSFVKNLIENMINGKNYKIVLLPNFESYTGYIYQYYSEKNKIAEINIYDTNKVSILKRKYSFFVDNINFFIDYFNEKLLLNINLRICNKTQGLDIFILHIIDEIKKSLSFIHDNSWENCFLKSERKIIKAIRRGFLPSTYFSVSYLTRNEDYIKILDYNKNYVGVEEFEKLKVYDESLSSYFIIENY